MLEIRIARSGQPTARIRGRFLHSPYDPEKEACRFAQERLKRQSPAAILLLGAELGHLRAALRRLHPQAGLLAVFYDQELHARSLDRPGPETSWHPGRGPLLEFLRGAVEELHTEGLAVLEWPASARIYPEVSLAAHRQVAQLLRERRGSLATTAALGRRWLANSFRNYLGLERILAPRPAASERPILIAASGPSLEQGLPVLSSLRSRMALWCLPSALSCLLEHGLAPDLVISTDPGFYASAHLQPLARSAAPLAMPLTAAPGAWAFPGGTLLLCQDAPYEESLLAAARYPALKVPPQGTVAATALELALSSTRFPVVWAGLDLSYLDLRGHARPSFFDRFLLARARRTSPLELQTFALAREQAPRRLPDSRARSGLALDTYAGWFASLPRSKCERLYRLNPSAVGLEGMRRLDNSALEGLLRGWTGGEQPASAPLHPGYPDRRARLRLALDLLEGWRRSCARSPGVQEALQDRQLSSLAYHYDAAALAKIIRLARRQSGPEASERWAALLLRLDGFLARLAGRLEARY
jgi:hypothetical protein